MLDLQQEKNKLQQCLDKVASYQLMHFRDKNLKIQSKSHSSDLVTEVDEYSEKIIIKYLKKAHPKHSIFCEESGSKYKNNSEYEWIIDPLDGTNNYAHGLPIFSISVALTYKKTTILGMVYAPFLKECYWATKGSGSFCNQTPLSINPENKLNKCIICTGFPYETKQPNNNLKNFELLLQKTQGLRRFGSAAYDLCLVASGYLNAYWELNLNIWDIAAGKLIVEEATGTCLTKNNKQKVSIVAANKEIATEIDHLISW